MEDNDFGDFSSALYTSSANAAFDNVGTTSWPTVLPSAEEERSSLMYLPPIPVTAVSQSRSEVTSAAFLSSGGTAVGVPGVTVVQSAHKSLEKAECGSESLQLATSRHGTTVQEANHGTEVAESDEDWGDFGVFEVPVVDPSILDTKTLKAADVSHFCHERDVTGRHSTVLSLNEVFRACFESSDKYKLSCGDAFGTNFSWLSKLHKSIDFTVPLCTWDASFLQSCYFSSIKVDPVLITNDDVTSIREWVPFVEGQSAALDLMESFGFEGAIESVSPTNPGPSFLGSAITGVCQSGPTLLDLTLPNSPSETVQEDSFVLDADLQGLQLHTLEMERQRTSIEQLALNERLVINRTTWIDSELEQLNEKGLTVITSAGSHNSDNNGKKGTFQEQLQQLGLDTSKTSLSIPAVSATPEMSISARLVLDRLPNISFMMEDTLVPIDNQYCKVDS